jgi:hypothetical protein
MEFRILTDNDEVELPITGMVKDGSIIIPFGKESWELEEVEEVYLIKQK